MPGNILNTISDVLSFRRQRFVLNEQVSHWTSIEAAWPQGSILGPLLFLIILIAFQTICRQMLMSLEAMRLFFP